VLIYQPPAAARDIPVIDLAASFGGDPTAFDAAAQAIHRACREMGFFYVANHGVPQPLVDDTFAWSKRFFDLPYADRLALHMKNSLSASGYDPGGQQLDSQDAGAEKAPPDLKESFAFGMDLPDEHPWAQKRLRGFGHIQWPPRLPGFRAHMIAHREAMTGLRNHLLRLLARSLDLPADWFQPHFEMAAMSTRLLKYRPQPDDAAFNQIGAGAHTDWGGVTILAQDDSGGLEVRNADGEWIEATPIPGTFVINLGDLMARWSNGLYNANMHRVKNNRTGRDRYSVVSFNDPRPDAVIEPIPGCVTGEFPRKFATCTAQEHITEMFRRSYGFTPGTATAS
jgi:isopenicillin N synthase-like dioxygenase